MIAVLLISVILLFTGQRWPGIRSLRMDDFYYLMEDFFPIFTRMLNVSLSIDEERPVGETEMG